MYCVLDIIIVLFCKIVLFGHILAFETHRCNHTSAVGAMSPLSLKSVCLAPVKSVSFSLPVHIKSLTGS